MEKKTGKYVEMAFQVWGLDVWGNAKDGFDVNDRSRVGTMKVRAPEVTYNFGTPHAFTRPHLSDERLVAALKSNGFLKPRVHTASITVEGESDHILYVSETRTGEPLWQLERIS